MDRTGQVVVPARARVSWGLMADYVALTKPRLVLMVAITTAVGYYLGSGASFNTAAFTSTLLGTALAAAGALALNQYLERDLDARMARTRHRPLAAGRLPLLPALTFGALLSVVGLLVLWLTVSPLAGGLTALTSAIYLFAYTPLKRVTPLCSIVGAVPGALPPVTGWVAARGEFGDGALVLFAILFLWQIPHSLAIARLFVGEYAEAGFRLLPVVDRDNRRTERAVVSYSAALMGVALMPTLLGMTGALYLTAALVLGAGFFATAVAFAVRRDGTARWLLVASLVYLPALLTMMALDRVAP
jgi:protoheme IX farnesyltransferase